MREIVDMHCHLLHGCDDGSTSLALSLEMLRAQAEQGVTTVCITPHFYSRQTSVEDFCARRDPRLRELVSPGEKVAIVTSDITRPMPT